MPRIAANSFTNQISTFWVFAGVLLLPPAMTGLLVILIYAHLWIRIWRTMGSRPIHRVLFSTAIIMMSAYAAAGTIAVGQLVQRANGWTGTGGWAILVI